MSGSVAAVVSSTVCVSITVPSASRNVTVKSWWYTAATVRFSVTAVKAVSHPAKT